MKEKVSSAVQKKSFKFKKHWIAIIVVVLVLGGVAFYYYNQYQHANNLLQNSGSSVNAQAQQLIDQVGKLIELPMSEQPTIATVSDVTKLSNQPFFADAKNGDKVLIYQQAGKAILYRPGINKIINVGPINMVSNNPTSTPEVSTESARP